MSKEELLKPRYKVIADAPPPFAFKVGNVLTFKSQTDAQGEYWFVSSPQWILLEDVQKYPHLFTKLEWWEDRAVEDLPLFVKVLTTDIKERTGEYRKVQKWDWADYQRCDNDMQLRAFIQDYVPVYDLQGEQFGCLHVKHLEPATEEEYNAYCASLTESA